MKQTEELDGIVMTKNHAVVIKHPVVIKQDQRFWKRILIVDDNEDVTCRASLQF
jgi:hypothetical protein